MLLVNTKGTIEEVNHQACLIMGLDHSQIIGQTFSWLYNQIQLKGCNISQIYKEIIETQSHSFMCPLLNKNGEFKYVKLTCHYMVDERFFIQMEDKTETLSLKEQLAQLESLSNLGELAASIAHEIRNPMTSLKGFTQLMRTETNARGNNYLSVIEQEIERIDKILNEFLLLSKPKQFSLESTNLNSLVAEVVEFMEPQALLVGVSLVAEYKSVNDAIYTDSVIIKQLLINSIKNAIEAMEDGGQIHITASIKDSEAEISIHDQGTGIDLENLQQYFHPFYTTKKSGTGLGLAHAARVMEEMKGRIEVANNLAGGASFYFYFPSVVKN